MGFRSVLVCLFLWATPAAAADAYIHAKGRDLVDPAGNTFLIRGIGLGNWLMPEGYMFKFKKARYPREIAALVTMALGPDDAALFWEKFRENYISREDIRQIKRAGFNTVRVPLHYGLFLGQNRSFGADADHPLTFEGPGWALIDRLIGWCREDGLKVILDLHAAPGGQTGVNHDDGTGFPLVFYVPREERRTTALWREIARRYRDEPTVLGYELLNEPISTYNDEDRLNPGLEPFYRRLTAAVREVDPNHLIFLAAAQWDQNIAVFGPPFARDLVYVYHQFWSPTGRDAIQDYINYSMRYQAPILLGEAGEASNQWNREYHALNERFGFGWSFWTYKNLDSPASVVSITPPPGWEKIAALGSMPQPSLEKAGLTREQAATILSAYLDAVLLRNAKFNRCYVQSLGLGQGMTGPCPPERK
ncbi:MAG: cellulase family glycosylhydrolase [Rhodospirillaceae bacterium]|nr:cellulase family glycosylhydrolase [Rhodospirillales bacterium]